MLFTELLLNVVSYFRRQSIKYSNVITLFNCPLTSMFSVRRRLKR